MSSLISFKSEFPGAGWATWALGAANLLQTRSHHIRPNALTSPPPHPFASLSVLLGAVVPHREGLKPHT